MLTNEITSSSTSAQSAHAELRDWLERFAAAVRAVDFESGRALFADDVVSFGTFVSMVHGLDGLVKNQWQKIWPCTRNFHFLLKEAHIEVHDDLGWIATPWLSHGRDEAGRWYDRPGRCTLILRRINCQWRCVHSHNSRQPTPRTTGDATPT